MSLPRLLLVTDQATASLPVLVAVTRALEALPPSSAIVLVREKHLDGGALLALLQSLRPVTRVHAALLAVSTRFDVAMAANADAVQLGGDAPPFAEVRRIAPPSLRLGVSLHGDELAPHGADWATVAPVFPTNSKPGATALGLERLADSCGRNAHVPVFALGGVTASNANTCLVAGAQGVAVRSAVLGSDDPALEARAMWASVSGPVHRA